MATPWLSTYKLTTSKRCVTTITDCSVTAWMVGFRAGCIELWNAAVYWLLPSCASILHLHPGLKSPPSCTKSTLSCTKLTSVLHLPWFLHYSSMGRRWKSGQYWCPWCNKHFRKEVLVVNHMSQPWSDCATSWMHNLEILSLSDQSTALPRGMWHSAGKCSPLPFYQTMH